MTSVCTFNAKQLRDPTLLLSLCTVTLSGVIFYKKKSQSLNLPPCAGKAGGNFMTGRTYLPQIMPKLAKSLLISLLTG